MSSLEESMRSFISQLEDVMARSRQIQHDDMLSLMSANPGFSPSSSDPVVDTKGAAAVALMSEYTIRRWVRRGRLRALGNRPYRFKTSDVEAARDSKVESTFDRDLREQIEKMNRRLDDE